MKILLTHDLYIPAINGVVVSMAALYEGLTALGHDVKILTLSNDRHSNENDYLYEKGSFPAGAIYPGVRASLKARNKLSKELAQWKPDIIHTQSEFFTFRMARYISKKCGTPMIHTYHTDYEYYVRYVQPVRKLDYPLAKLLVRNRLHGIKHVIVPSEKSKEQLQTFGITNPMTVIPTLLPKVKEVLTAEEAAALRGRYGIPDEAPILLFLGRIAEEKNIQELLAMHKELLQKMPDAYFLLVGDGPFRKMVEKAIEKIGTGHRVVMAGAAPHSEVWKYYQLADVFLNASKSETQGLTFLEAVNNGLPIVCRYDRCLEGLEGKLFFYENTEDFCKLIAQALEQKRQPGLQTTTEEDFANQVLRIYEQCV